jgi:hypothetical protein
VPSSSSEGHRKLAGRLITLRGSAAAAAALSSVAAVMAGLALNLGSERAGTAAVTAAALLIAVVSAYLGWRASTRASADFDQQAQAASEAAAIQRMLNVLAGDWRKPLWAPQVNLELSVALAPYNRASAVASETVSVFISSLAADPRVTFLVGEPGSGKSTVLRKIAIELLSRAKAPEYRTRALFLNSRTWTPGQPLQEWAARAAAQTYGISAGVSDYWVRDMRCVLLVDALDEMPAQRWESFVSAANSWLASGVGGSAVFTCRGMSYASTFYRIQHEQVATLQPVSSGIVAAELKEFAPSMADTATLRAVADLLKSDGHESSLSPLMLQMLVGALSANELPKGGHYSSSGVGVETIRLARELEGRGEFESAERLYRAVASETGSPFSSLAGIRLSLLLARSGDLQEAKRSLQASVADQISESLDSPRATAGNEDLSNDEQAVLAVLSRSRSLDDAQVSALCDLSPSRTNAALRNLRDAGLVEVLSARGLEARYRRSAVRIAS